jgi:hypothetical protein
LAVTMSSATCGPCRLPCCTFLRHHFGHRSNLKSVPSDLTDRSGIAANSARANTLNACWPVPAFWYPPKDPATMRRSAVDASSGSWRPRLHSRARGAVDPVDRNSRSSLPPVNSCPSR